MANVFLEDRCDLRQVEAGALQVRVGERHLRSEVALRGSGIDERLVVLEGELRGDRLVRGLADAGHRGEEAAQSRGLGVERGEEGAALLHLVLRQAGVQRLGEVVPEAEQAFVRHLEHSADVGRLALVEEQAGRSGVAVRALLALEKAKRHERVEEVARRARMQAQPRAQCFAVQGLLREHGEEFHADGAQEHLRPPEAEAHLHDVFGSDVLFQVACCF